VLRENCTTNCYVRKQENSQINYLSSHLKNLQKEEQYKPKAKKMYWKNKREKSMKLKTKKKSEKPTKQKDGSWNNE
jgi:hypothetical protein